MRQASHTVVAWSDQSGRCNSTLLLLLPLLGQSYSKAIESQCMTLQQVKEVLTKQLVEKLTLSGYA